MGVFNMFRKKTTVDFETGENTALRMTELTQEWKIFELSAFSIYFGKMTEKMLSEKGFKIDTDLALLAEKIALIHTEISELVDAYKKGKGPVEEGMELADIIIRLLNIPVMYANVFDRIKELGSIDASQTLVIKALSERTTQAVIDSSFHTYRLEVANAMHEKTTELKYAVIKMEDSDDGVDKVVKIIFDMILCCDLYLRLSPIQGELYGYVERKMGENFKRPHRFNVSENFK